MISLFRKLLIGILYLVTAVVLCAQPAIHLNNASFDLGSIYHGEIKTVALIVRNNGTEPLSILGVETSCGCTSTKQSVTALAPGTQDTITVSFNSLGFYGSITKIVSVHSNDPTSPVVEARLTGKVTSLLETVPPMQVINFGGSTAGTTASVSFLFRNTTPDQITVRRITCVDTSVHTSFPIGSIAPNDSVMVSFSFTPLTRSFSENYFYVETTDPRQFKIPFRFMYLGR